MSQNSPIPPPVVLVVEDEPVLRLMAVDLVESLGYEVVEAMDATDAVRILENRPDIRVVFTDIDMPGGYDGMKLAAAIRDRWPPIELVITSGIQHPSLSELPVRAVFFQKPYRRDLVAKAIKQFASA